MPSSQMFTKSIPMNQDEKVFNLLEATNLNWSVQREPLFVKVGDKEIMSESFAIMKGEKYLGTVGTQYRPFQNSELAQTIVTASEGITSDEMRGGHLADERKVYFQAAIDPVRIGNSEIKRWITCTNSHDGSTSIGFGSSNTVVVCQNTFYRAYRELSKFRHTVNAGERIKVAVQEFRDALLLDSKLMDSFMRMSDFKLDQPIVERVLETIFGVTKEVKREDISAKK